MHKLPRHLLERFAEHFSNQRKGFKLQEITPFFSSYQTGLPSAELTGRPIPKKREHFVQIVELLDAKNQRYALWDLCNAPPPLKSGPGKDVRMELLKELFASDGITPVGIYLSKITLNGVKESWWIATSRLPHSSSAAVTAARTMLESTCKTILDDEPNGEPDTSHGNLNKLLKNTRKKLKLEAEKANSDSLNGLIAGMSQIASALASISNSAGDRHGSEDGVRLEDSTVASVAVHASGIVCCILAQVYIDQRFSEASDC